MSVEQISWGEELVPGADSPNAVGTVTWDAVPDAIFKLETTPDGRLVEFSVRAKPGARLTARGLRRAPLGEMERAVRSEAHELALRELDLHASPGGIARRSREPVSYRPSEEEVASVVERRALAIAAFRMANDFAERPRPGSAGRGDTHYAAVAASYVALLDAGDPRPVAALADQLHLSVTTVRNLLYKARERGLLTSAGRGRAGGQLTDKAKEMLSGNDQAS